MKLLIATVGSRGDLQPYVALVERYLNRLFRRTT